MKKLNEIVSLVPERLVLQLCGNGPLLGRADEVEVLLLRLS